MIDYIKGQIAELTPLYAVLETGGIGYEVNITLSTFTALSDRKETKLFVTEVIREDAHLLFGFMNKGERELFLLLNSVSGVGPNTARMIMSGYSAGEMRQILATGNVAALNRIKGIGGKTAQRIVVDLKDKVLKIDLGTGEAIEAVEQTVLFDSEIRQEAVSALTMLGFPAAASTKVVDKILKSDPDQAVEAVIRQALKML
ncbi:MAG: Holliday junction branch migration protein RuvA [Paludibacteraceae bacterium]|nr:Holliday junction branch migration protein RuvA [Paludibacteraceae bacterium]